MTASKGTIPVGFASSGLVYTYTFDESYHVTRVDWSVPFTTLSGTLMRDATWEPSGGLATWKDPSGSYTFFVNRVTGAGRITSTNFNIPSIVMSDVYGYAIDGNLANASGNVGHDSLSRITTDRLSSGSQTYSYDDAGNRTLNSALPYTYVATTSDRLATAEGLTYAYDAAGNVTARTPGVNTIGYSDDGRMISVNTGAGTTTYSRDYRGLRILKAGAGGAGTYTFDPEGQLLSWQGPVQTGAPCGGSTYKYLPNESFLHVDGRPIAVIKTRAVACGSGPYSTFIVDGVFAYYTEKMGVPRAAYSYSAGQITRVWLANSPVGPSFDAFANPLTAINEDPDGNGQLFSVAFRLPGQFALGTLEGGPTTTTGGLHENWYRLFDSVVGRYLQPDPLGQTADPALYRYVANRPLAAIDPTGEKLRIDAFTNGWVRVGVDTRDSCCKSKGEARFVLYSLGTMASGLSSFTAPVSSMSPVPLAPTATNPLNQGTTQLYCTDCGADRAVEKRLTQFAADGVRYGPVNNPGLGVYNQTGFINAILQAAGNPKPCDGTDFDNQSDVGCTSCFP